MKGKIILPFFLLVLLFILFAIPASASVSDWIGWITGKAAEEEQSAPILEQPASIPAPVAVAVVEEQVTCAFVNSNSEQKCYGGAFSCAGTGSCTVQVSGEQGKQIGWKSSCGGYAYTTIDGSNENAEFKCETLTQPVAQPPASTTSTSEPTSILQSKEQVKCVFLGSASAQKCYTDDGRFACSGTGSCTADVSGAMGTKLEWKGSCGGYAYTFIDGKNEYAEFKCEQATVPTPTATPTAPTTTSGGATQTQTVTSTTLPASTIVIKEQAKCIFANSASAQKCYTDDGRFGCAGTGSCIADVAGSSGARLAWKSSCGGYAYTFIDGNNDYAEFKCEVPAIETTAQVQVPVENMREQVKCLFTNSNSEQKCGSESSGCAGTGSCVADVSGGRGRMLTWKSSCGGYAYTVIDGNNEYAEFNCQQNIQQTAAVASTTVPSQPVTASEQIKREETKEIVTCVFAKSDSEQKCYSDDSRFACSGKDSCTIGILGEVGKKLTWKSSCGGYAYSVIDGGNENAEFSCIPAADVTQEQISGKGFKNVYWQCYDGEEGKSAVSGGPCKSSEVWQNDAQESCNGHCRTYDEEAITKCGVNTFSVSGECYQGEGGGDEFFSPEARGEKKIAMPPDSKTGDIMLLYFYMDSCRHCAGMDEELDKISKTGIDVKKINIVSDADLAKSYRLVGVPSFVTLRYEKDGIKEFSMTGRTDSSNILRWISQIKGNAIPSETAEEKRELKEEILICKDSCPLDGKCYPFGYRKSGRYCSDDGAFREQLAGEMPCDNNFECSTNVCIDGKCISSGMIRKVMDWFRRLF